jgi:hypothetical protein
MTFKQLKSQIKEELKDHAQIIRRGKFLRKPKNRIDVTKEDKKLYYYSTWFDEYKVKMLSNDYRHKHIAYCHFFNGTDYGLIENPRSDNKRNQKKVDAFIKHWSGELDEEVVCNCA